MEEAERQSQFVTVIERIHNGETISEAETKELCDLADALGGKWETSVNDSGETVTCMWICSPSNFACNPNSPPPNCRCHKVCW